jgi:Family of unknown function (DUF6460)
MEKWLGGHPLGVIVRLAIYSVIVGIVLAALGLSPFQLFDYARVMMLRIYHLGFDAFGWAAQYFLLGAVIVIPIWLIRRAFAVAKQRDGQKS